MRKNEPQNVKNGLGTTKVHDAKGLREKSVYPSKVPCLGVEYFSSLLRGAIEIEAWNHELGLAGLKISLSTDNAQIG